MPLDIVVNVVRGCAHRRAELAAVTVLSVLRAEIEDSGVDVLPLVDGH